MTTNGKPEPGKFKIAAILLIPFILGILIGLFLLIAIKPPVLTALSPEEVFQHYQDGDATIIDTRSLFFYNKSRIPGSIRIQPGNLTANLHLLPEKNGLIITYCDCPAGGTAAELLIELDELDFTNLAYMQGSFTSIWKNENAYPVTSGPVQWLAVSLRKYSNLR